LVRRFTALCFITILLPALSILLRAGVPEIKGCGLTKEKAAEILDGHIPNAKVVDVQTAPIPALCEVVLEVQGGQKGILYMEPSGKMLMTGSILETESGTDLTKLRVSGLNKKDPSQIPLKDALFMGREDAKYKAIVFADPECVSCQKLHQEMKKVVAQRSDIAFYIKLYPLTTIHSEAYEQSKSIICAHSLQLLEDAFENKPIPPPSCDTTAIDETIKFAKSFGIIGTPTVVLPDGRLLDGMYTAEQLIKWIDNK